MRSLVLLLAACHHVSGLGCIKEVCKNRKLAFRDCTTEQCGRYGSKRWNGRILHALDVRCDAGEAVVAPFDATLSHFSPYNDGSDWDNGLRFTGKGMWTNYDVELSHLRPVVTSGEVKKGDVVGYAVSLDKAPEDARKQLRKERSSTFVMVRAKKNRRNIDPTTHFFNCSCTGQICETNHGNHIIGGYKSHDRFGVGFQLHCKDKQINTGAGDTDADRAPAVYAPIDGSRVGRVRLRSPDARRGEYACQDEGIFITGTGRWEDYEARIYNVRYEGEPGARQIKAGDVVAKRLVCGSQLITTIFVELRHRSRIIDFRSQLLGRNCTLPDAHSTA